MKALVDLGHAIARITAERSISNGIRLTIVEPSTLETDATSADAVMTDGATKALIEHLQRALDFRGGAAGKLRGV